MMYSEMLNKFCQDLIPGNEPWKYLTETRGLSSFTIDDLSIGWCNSHTFDSLGVDLIDRVVFPIKQYSDGSVIGFGGRTLGSGPKYLNSPASEIYNKSRVLYNLDIAGDYILETGQAILVEGYMDVAALWDKNIRNVVAICGTALNPWHIRLLKRYADNIAVVFDGDPAGIKTMFAAKSICDMESMPLKQVFIPFGLDPDEYINSCGKDAFVNLLNEV